jgi:hypothetical protein
MLFTADSACCLQTFQLRRTFFKSMRMFATRNAKKFLPIAFIAIVATFLAEVSVAASELFSPEVGARFSLRDKTAAITKVSTLPYVDSEYSRLFKFDSAENPKLHELRDRFHLRELISAATNELDQQILLMDWVHNRFKKFGQPTKQTRGALDILSGIDSGETFFCTQYAQLMASAAASLGWIDRVLALRRHQDSRPGSSEHSTTEIWSNQHRKWVMLDPTSNMYLEANSVPLNAYEIRHEWFYNNGINLTFVVGKEKKRYRKSDLPIFLKKFPSFGDLTIDPHELDKYGFIGYIPNTDLMDSGFDYGQMFITKDQLCNGTQWHKRKLPAHPGIDPYFPINQAALMLSVEGDSLRLEAQTLTPNFKQFEFSLNDSNWQPTAHSFAVKPRLGPNKLQVRTVNQFDVPGAATLIEFSIKN